MLSPLAQRFRDEVAPKLIDKMGNGGVQVVFREVIQNPDPLKQPLVSQSRREIKSWAKGVTSQMVVSDPNLQSTDIRILVAAVDFAPVTGGMVTVNGEDRRIVRVDAIPAADDPVIFWFYVR